MNKEIGSVNTAATAANFRMMKWFQQLPGVSAILSHIPPGQFGRYLLVGIWNTLFGYLSYAAFTAFFARFSQHGYIPAFLVSSLLNITAAFLIYKRYVFKTA